MPGNILPKNTLAGSVTSIYKSNNDHFGGSAQLGANLEDVFINARYSYQNFADYRVPATQFVYNNFVLPIENNRLKNTAGRKENISISAGISRTWGITRVLFSRYSLTAGLFSGAVGIPRSYTLFDDGNARDIDTPGQSVNHYRASINQSLIFGEDHLVIDAGFQRNLRQETSFPEFHSIPSSQIDPNNTLALELDLETYSISAHYEDHITESLKAIYGVSGQWQNNRRGGFEFLLPDFRTFRSGIFTLLEKQVHKNWLINGGLRFDYARNDSDYFRQNVWNSNEVVTDSLVAPASDRTFYNWSASIGSNWTLQNGRYIVKANLGKSFRVPYPAETVSNGIHHGTFRHEQGTLDLDSEHGYQLDASLSWNLEGFTGSVALYANYFENYIYLGPTFPAQFSPLPEAGQIFRYRQDDAIYMGGELEWTWQAFSFAQLHQAIDFVQSYNPETQLALPFTPQPAIRTDIRFESNAEMLEDAFLELTHQYHFAAAGPSRVDRSEQATPAYQLWGIGLGTDLHVGKQVLECNIQVQNLLNTAYLAHLSRYRLLNIPEQGRNVVVNLKIPFNARIRG
ncbi:MAG: TonB-dependent receptor [Bacteroidota bacterium]